jgi:hypothetical protein
MNRELFRHFFRRLFDSEFVSNPGEMKTVFAGILAIIASLGGLLAQVYYHKYLVLQQLDTPDPFRRAYLADIVFLETLVMVAMGLFTTVQWTSLFPALRDYLALAGLPLRTREIFIAKFSALAGLSGATLLTLTLAPSFILAAIARGKYLPGTIFHIPAAFVSSYLAGAFVFFSLVALEGILLNITPVHLFPRVSLAAQGLLVAALVGSFPFALSIPNIHPYVDLRPDWILWVPPLWFVGIHQVIVGNREPMALALANRAWIATGISFAAALIAYWWSYRRHRRRVLEAPAVESSGGSEWVQVLLDRVIPDPRQLGVFAFIGKTLGRSQQHRLILTGFGAIGLALIVEGFLGVSHGARGAFREAAVAIPLALSLFLLAGLRYLFRLPVELRANWIFRIEAPGHGDELLRGVEVFLYDSALLPLAVMTLLVETALLGSSEGLMAAVLCTLSSVALVECLLFSFQRIPFTSSYLPGQRPLVNVILGYALVSIIYVSSLAGLISWCAESVPRTLVLAGCLGAIAYSLRGARRRVHHVYHLEFEELPEPIVETLSIDKD